MILSFILFDQNPNICVVFSPPGQSILQTSHTRWEQSVTCVIIGNDLVPRFSFRSWSLFLRVGDHSNMFIIDTSLP